MKNIDILLASLKVLSLQLMTMREHFASPSSRSSIFEICRKLGQRSPPIPVLERVCNVLSKLPVFYPESMKTDIKELFDILQILSKSPLRESYPFSALAKLMRMIFTLVQPEKNEYLEPLLKALIASQRDSSRTRT